MPRFDERFLLQLLQACAAAEPAPLYPSRFAQEARVDRDELDRSLDELRRRGLIRLTDWTPDVGQGRAVTDAGKQALAAGRLPLEPVVEKPAPSTALDRGEIARDAILSPAPPIVGRVLIAINIVVFLFGAIYGQLHGYSPTDYLLGRDSHAARPTTQLLVDLGGIFTPRMMNDPRVDLARPEFERLLISLFLHSGLLHLGMNMYFLYTLGRVIESIWGRWRFLAIYLIAGLVGSCLVVITELAQDRARYPVIVGASSSLFGMFASMVVWFLFNQGHLPERFIEAWRQNIGVNLMLLVAVNFFPGVSWQAHLGGAIGGALAAMLLHMQRFHPSAVLRWLALVGVPCVPLGFFVGLLWMAGWI